MAEIRTSSGVPEADTSPKEAMTGLVRRTRRMARHIRSLASASPPGLSTRSTIAATFCAQYSQVGRAHTLRCRKPHRALPSPHLESTHARSDATNLAKMRRRQNRKGAAAAAAAADLLLLDLAQLPDDVVGLDLAAARLAVAANDGAAGADD